MLIKLIQKKHREFRSLKGEANVTSESGQKHDWLTGRRILEWLVRVGVAGSPGEGGCMGEWGTG